MRCALVTTIHDPGGRLLPALDARGGQLARYAGVFATVTGETAPALRQRLEGTRATLLVGGVEIGASRRRALGAAFDAGCDSVLYCDFDRWLHWAGAFEAELRALPERLGRRRPAPWYACLGRTRRAYATHPYVQRLAERATNHALGLALGRRIDATAGACWLAREGASIVLRESVETTNATDLEWPALIYRAAPQRLAYVATEGLEFETAEFYADEVAAAGGLAAWERVRYERPDAWQARLKLALDSVRAALVVLGTSAAPVMLSEAKYPRSLGPA